MYNGNFLHNLIYGLNGVGKTTLLEAIFLVAFGKSFLNRKKADMVNHNANEFIIRLTCAHSHGFNQVSACYHNRFSPQFSSIYHQD